MGRTVMSNGKWETVQLEGLSQFMYLIEHFGNTPEQALELMKEHNQDTKDAELFVKMYLKQKGNTNETTN